MVAKTLTVALLLAASASHSNPYECLIEPNQSIEIRSSV